MAPANLIENNQFPISLFNSPIGYAKNPLLYDQDSTRSSISTAASWEAVTRPVEKSPAANNFTFDKLPYEIRLKVANELSQFDCIKLLRVNKALYTSTVPRLYQYIVIDQDFNVFNNEKEYSFRHFESRQDLGGTARQRKEFSCTYINSSYNFKRFIKEYNTKFSREYKDNREDVEFPHIKKFECINLPDSLNIYDYDLNARLIQLFQNFVHLRQLIWINDNFRLEFLYNMPRKELVHTLILNIKFSNYLNELPEDNELDDCSRLNFPNLVNLQIQPFQNSRKLTKIIDNLLVNTNDSVRVSTNIRALVLSRFHKHAEANSNNNILLPNSRDLISFRNLDSITNGGTHSTIHSTLHDMELHSLAALFKNTKLHRLCNLSVLALDNMLVSPNDAKLFIDSVNLPNLKSLFLKGMSEYQILDHNEIDSEMGRRQLLTMLQPSFLVQISYHLTGLKNLCIDYREAMVDTVPDFLQNLPYACLKSLELVIRLNHTIPLPTESDERKYFSRYADAIVNFSCSLTKLSLQIRSEVDNYQDSTNFNVLAAIPNNTGFYEKLYKMQKLKGIRLNPGDNANEVLELVRHLKTLKKVDIFGSRAGGCPNLGLGMIHPNIYDEWYKVQHVALFYLQSNPNIDYIRINSFIFECDGTTLKINPRYGITRWFDSHVRPTYSLD